MAFGENHEFTKLVPNLGGSDPDDAFCRVPYDKGSALLFTIEQAVGGPGHPTSPTHAAGLRLYFESITWISCCRTGFDSSSSDQLIIAFIRLRYRNYTKPYSLYRSCLPIHTIANVTSLSFSFLDEFEENTSISVAIGSNATILDSYHIDF